MAQKTEKEETEFKAPETLIRCVNNCGLAGSPATNNMCQNCFNAAIIKPPHIFPAAVSPRSGAPRALEPPALNDLPPPPEIRLPSAPDPDLSRREVNRCFGCRRRVRLAGFRCRCGELFCAEHRYSDRHDCSFDYKSAGRDAIARENPVVKAAKIVRV